MRSPWSSWVRIAAITASLSLGLWASTFGAFLVGAAMDDLGLSAVEAGGLVSAELVSAGTTSLLAAPFIRRYSTARLALLSAAFGISMQVASVYMDSFGLLLPFRVGSGVAGGLLIAASSYVAASSFNPDRAFSYSISIFMLGSIILMQVMGIIVGDHGLDGAYWTQAVALLLGSLLFFWLSPEKTPEIGQHSHEPVRPRRDWIILISIILIFGVFVGPMYYFFERLGTHVGMETDRIGLFLSAGTLAGFFGALLAGRASDWLGRRRPMMIGLILLASSGLLYAFAGSESAFLVTNVIFWVSYMFLYSFFFATAAAFDPTGRLSVACGGINQFTVALGPVLGGVLFEWASFPALGGCAAVGLSAAFLIVALKGRFLDQLDPR